MRSATQSRRARLIVLANGLNSGLRRAVGMTREDLSACHSISLGFDASPLSGDAFDFPSLTYFPELTAARIAYVTLFPIGAGMRANVFVYRDSRDPWLHRLRNAPQDTLFAALPGLQRLTGDFSATNVSKIRPVDLYVTRSCRQPGVVLVGDAFSTSCPAAGTGVNKVLTDVVQLCAVHIPRWLASPGMAEEKIAAFYDDPVKRACDAQSTDKAYYLRSLSTEPGLPWRARRGPFRRPARIRPRPADGRAAIAAAGSSARRRGRRRRAVAHFRGITPAERKSRGIDVHCQGARFSYPESRRATDPPAGYRQDDLAAASCGFLRSWYDYLRVVTCARGNRPFFAFLGTT
jgi:hypothetical protein